MSEKTKTSETSSISGFTLIEMLIITALLGFVGYMIYGSLNISRKLYDDSLDKTEVLQQLRYTISSIGKDIQNVSRSSSVPSLTGINRVYDFKNDPYETDLISLKLLSSKSMFDHSLQNSGITFSNR